ncbi:hypothetical protein SH501x_000640 [Pirellulaceae bacterium SH501]
MNPTFQAPDDDIPEHADETAGINLPQPERETSNAPEGEVANSQQAESSPGWVVSPTASSRTSPLNSKRSESPGFGKFLPPVLGGLAAIPIAIAILWYGFGKDLGNAGPTVARYIPAIVPKHLRGDPFRDDGTLGGYSSHDSDDDERPFPPTPRLPTGPSSELPSLSDSSKPLTREDSAPKQEESAPKNEEQPTIPPPASESPATESKQLPSAEKVSNDREQSVPTAEMETATTAAKPSIKDAILQCDQVQSKLKETWSSADGEQRQAMARDFYSQCLNLANLVASQKGISLQAWKRELDNWSRDFLSEPAFPRLLGLCLDGKIEGLPPHQSGDAILFIEPIGKPKTDSNDWQITTALTVNGEKVMLLIPEAVHRKYLTQAEEEPKPSLVIGIWQKNDSQAPSIEAVYISR